VKIAPTLHSERLELRPWSDADLAMLTELSATPEVIRYLGNGQFWTPQRAAEVAQATLTHWERHGFGWRVATIRETGEKIGFIALNFAGEGTVGVDPDEYELGWWLAPGAWRRGLASEGARMVRDDAFERLEVPSLIARIQPANATSRGVAEGLGMTLDFETVGRTGEPVVVYRLGRGQPTSGTGVTPPRTGRLPPP
jgi:RimJ/RimL family protein N-acetyltransferase